MTMTGPTPTAALGVGLELTRAQVAIAPYGVTLGELQRRVSTQLGMEVSRSTVTKIFNGDRRPSLEMAHALAHALGISLDQFYGIMESLRHSVGQMEQAG